MENNKAYLQKMPWVFLLGILNVAVLYIINPWLYNSEVRYTPPGIVENISYLLLPALTYISLGIITSKWKEAAIAFAASIVINALFIFVFAPDSDDAGSAIKITLTYRLITFFLYPVPIFLFVALQTGLVKRLWMMYPIIFFLLLGFSLSSYATSMTPIAYIVGSDMKELATAIFSFIVKVAFFATQVLVICEIANIGTGKTYTNKPTLINLGNDYGNKLSNILTFWALKLCMFMVILGSAAAFAQILQMMEGSSYYGAFSNEDTRKYFVYTSFFMVISFAFLAIFLSWYLRKFVLEVFISHGIHSKFLYWFSYIPVLGFFGFLVVQLENVKHIKYNQKVASIGAFAGSSTAGVTGVIFFLMGLRLIMQLVDGDPAYIFSVILSGALLVWLMASSTGYQVTLWLTGIALFFLLLFALLSNTTNSSMQDTYGIMYALLLAQLVSVIFIYPVYHFDQFQYMPSEDPYPLAPDDPEFSLFA